MFTGKQIEYYFICHRKLWLFKNHITMEHNSELVTMGSFISDNSYDRQKHELHIQDEENEAVLDFYDNKKNILHEIKKSKKMEESHLWQVKFYLKLLEDKGIDGVTALIDYPHLKKRTEVSLTEADRVRLKEIKAGISEISQRTNPPSVINKPFCKQCSYYELCYV